MMASRAAQAFVENRDQINGLDCLLDFYTREGDGESALLVRLLLLEVLVMLANDCALLDALECMPA